MNYKYLKLLLIIQILTISIIVNGQYDYREGYIITNENDTIKGYVEYSNIKILADYCYFKTDSLSTVKKYSPSEILGFGFKNSKCFISKKIEIDGKPQMKFLEYLVNGIVDLYFYIDPKNYDYYYIEKNDKLVELSNKGRIITEGEKKYISGQDNYKGILLYVTKEAPDLKPIIKDMEFGHKSFIDIAVKYHDYVCDSIECIDYTKKNIILNDAKWIISAGLSLCFGGVNLSLQNYLRYNGLYESEIINSNLGNDYGLNILNAKRSCFYPGIFMNINANWYTSFQIEFWYKKLEFDLNNNSLKFNSLSIPILIKKELMYYEKLSPVLFAGININSLLNAKLSTIEIEYEYEYGLNNSNRITNSTHIDDYNFINSNEIALGYGIIYGCGVIYHINENRSFCFEIRGNNDNYFSSGKLLNPLIYYQPSIKLFEYTVTLSGFITF